MQTNVPGSIWQPRFCSSNGDPLQLGNCPLESGAAETWPGGRTVPAAGARRTRLCSSSFRCRSRSSRSVRADSAVGISAAAAGSRACRAREDFKLALLLVALARQFDDFEANVQIGQTRHFLVLHYLVAGSDRTLQADGYDCVNRTHVFGLDDQRRCDAAWPGNDRDRERRRRPEAAKREHS